MRTRALVSHAPTSVDVEARKFSEILTSEAPVRTYIPHPGKDGECIEADEILVSGGIDLSRSRGMPLVDAHDTSSIDRVLGVVDDVRAEPTEALGSCIVIDSRVVPARAELMLAIAEGFYFLGAATIPASAVGAPHRAKCGQNAKGSAKNYSVSGSRIRRQCLGKRSLARRNRRKVLGR